jgi:hypothetical protein
VVISTTPFEARDPDTFSVTAIHPEQVAPGQVLDALDEELDSLASTPPTADELAKVTARWTAALYGEHDRLVSPQLAEEHRVTQDGTILMIPGERSERMPVRFAASRPCPLMEPSRPFSAWERSGRGRSPGLCYDA